MTKEKYLKDRQALITEAETLVNEGKIEESKKKRAEIEKLDADFEAAATEAANIRALSDAAPASAPAGLPVVENSPQAVDADVYKTAWLKNLLGREMTAEEEETLTSITSASTSAGAAIPAPMQDEILTKLKQQAPMLEEITLLHVEGYVKYAVEGVVADATIHDEGAAITPDADTLVEVTLGGYEIVKQVQISETVKTMAIPAFERWLVDMLVDKIAGAITGYLITGTGSSQPQGIDKVATWGATNSVTVAKSASTTGANVRALIGLLPGGYDANAKFVMSKTEFMPLQDNSKNSIVKSEGKNYFVYGYPVILDERVTLGEAYLGDIKTIVGNLPQSIQVKGGYDTKTNSYIFNGVAIFDSKAPITDAFVKLIKATT
jgi:HK97 family phage major capsid protein